MNINKDWVHDPENIIKYLHLPNIREIVLKAVQSNGRAIQYTPYCSDKEVVLAAVKQNGRAISYTTFCSDKEVIINAMLNEASVLEYSKISDDKELQFIQPDPQHRRFIRNIAIYDVRFGFY